MTTTMDNEDDLIARMASLLVPRSENEAELLEDGSRLMFTLRRPLNENLYDDEGGSAGGSAPPTPERSASPTPERSVPTSSEHSVPTSSDGDAAPDAADLRDEAEPHLVDTLRLSASEERGLQWSMAREVDGGTTLYTEPPMVYVSLFDDDATRPLNDRLCRRLLPIGAPDSRAVTLASLYDDNDAPLSKTDTDAAGGRGGRAPPELGGDSGVSASLEWTLTYLLLTRIPVDDVRRTCSQMRQPGPYSYAMELRRAFGAMPDVRMQIRELTNIANNRGLDGKKRSEATRMLEEAQKHHDALQERYATTRAWLNKIMVSTMKTPAPKSKPGAYSIDDILLIYGIVTRNALHMRSPLSGATYGLALYPGAAHMAHACVPTGRAVFDEHGVLRVEAAGHLERGTLITLDRVLANEPIVRCLQTAPAWLRTSADSMIGVRCRCDECVRALNWLRTAGGSTLPTPGGNSDGDAAPDTDANKDGALEAPPLDPSKEADRQKIDSIIKAVDSTWCDPEGAGGSSGGADPAGPPEDLIFSQMLALPRMTNALEVLLALGRARLMEMFGAKVYSMRALSVARVLVDAAARQPKLVHDALGGADIVVSAIDYENRVGRTLIVGKLREQGASDALIYRRLVEHRERSRFIGFAASTAYVVSEAVRTLTTLDGMTAALKQVLPVVDAHKLFDDAFRHMVLGTALLPLDVTTVPVIATVSAAAKLKLESLQLRLIGLVIQSFTSDDEAQLN